MDDAAVSKLRHDLRSPLMVISGFARLLGGEVPPSDADRREYAERIEAACDEMRRLVEEFGAAQ